MKTLAIIALLLTTAPALLLATSPAKANNVTMPAQFIGEWCYSSDYNDDPKSRMDEKYEYRLPSWAEEGQRDKNKILSIEYWGFTFADENVTFTPLSVSGREDCAPSGCGYLAKIVAQSMDSAEPRVFLIWRYKGSLSVEEAKGPTQAMQIRCFWTPDSKGCPKYELECPGTGVENCVTKKSFY